MRNRTYGGVRGRKTKVGRKLLRFPPTRFIQFMFTVKLVLTVEKRIDYNEENIILDRNLYMYGRCGFGSHARGWAVLFA